MDIALEWLKNIASVFTALNHIKNINGAQPMVLFEVHVKTFLKGTDMLRTILLAGTLLMPLITFAQSSTAFAHANPNASFQRSTVHAPEIDGGNAVLGLALLGGIITLIVARKNTHEKKDD